MPRSGVPPKERAMLAESLWESLVDPFKIPAESDDNDGREAEAR